MVLDRNFKFEDKVGIIKLKKEIYSKEVLIQTTYVLIEDYYFFIDLDENENFIIEIRNKDLNKEIFEKDIMIFFDELIESSSYIEQLKRSSKIRETILERALLSQKE